MQRYDVERILGCIRGRLRGGNADIFLRRHLSLLSRLPAFPFPHLSPMDVDVDVKINKQIKKGTS